MSKFVQVDFSTHHQGVERVENAVSYLKSRPWGRNGARLQAGVLVAAVVAALLVVSNQLIETITDGHLFAAWIGLWAVGFAAMALLARPASQFVAKLRNARREQQAARLAAAQDAYYWQAALDDERLMADIRSAMGRVGG
jgi:hypothetical protein